MVRKSLEPLHVDHLFKAHQMHPVPEIPLVPVHKDDRLGRDRRKHALPVGVDGDNPITSFGQIHVPHRRRIENHDLQDLFGVGETSPPHAGRNGVNRDGERRSISRSIFLSGRHFFIDTSDLTPESWPTLSLIRPPTDEVVRHYRTVLYPLQDRVLGLCPWPEGWTLSGVTVLSRFMADHRFSDDLDFFSIMMIPKSSSGIVDALRAFCVTPVFRSRQKWKPTISADFFSMTETIPLRSSAFLSHGRLLDLFADSITLWSTLRKIWRLTNSMLSLEETLPGIFTTSGIWKAPYPFHKPSICLGVFTDPLAERISWSSQDESRHRMSFPFMQPESLTLRGFRPFCLASQMKFSVDSPSNPKRSKKTPRIY